MLPFHLTQFGNPHSRTHAYGWESEEAVEKARAVRRATCLLIYFVSLLFSTCKVASQLWLNATLIYTTCFIIMISKIIIFILFIF